MAKFKAQVVTQRGLNLIAKAQAGATIQFTRMASGDGVYAPDENLIGKTALKSEKQSFLISKTEYISTGTVKSVGILENTGLAAGYYIREIGLFANDPDLGEILFAIDIAEVPDFFPEDSGGATASITIDFISSVGNASTSTAIVDPNAAVVSVLDFNAHLADNAKHITGAERTAWNGKVDSIAGKGLSTNDYNNTEKAEVAKVADKADITYVDAKTAGVVNGSPIPVTLASQMTDHDRNYVYLGTEAGYTAGNWYYWNGSAFTDTGKKYQETGIANDSIELKHFTSDVSSKLSAYKNVALELGYYYDVSYVKITANVAFTCIKLDDVKPGDKFRINGFFANVDGQYYGLYAVNGSGVLIESSYITSLGLSGVMTNYIYTIPVNCATLYINMLTNQGVECKLEKLQAVDITDYETFKTGVEPLQRNYDYLEYTNRHWINLSDSYSWTAGQWAGYSGGVITHNANASFSYSANIPVSDGDIYRLYDGESTSASNWSANARGIFVDVHGNYVAHIPVENQDNLFNEIVVPHRATHMIVNKITSTNFLILKMVDFENIFDGSNSANYVTGEYIDNDGSVVAQGDLAHTIVLTVQPGVMYRVSDAYGAEGGAVPKRGVFLNDVNGVVGYIKFTGHAPYPWNDFIIPPTAIKLIVNAAAGVIARMTVNKATTPARIEMYDISKTKNKTWVSIGDSITWYSDWEHIVQNATQLWFWNHGYSNGTIGRATDTVTFPDIFSDEHLSSIITKNPDVITIMGGVNNGSGGVTEGNQSDLWATYGTEDRTTYYGAYAYAIKTFLMALPKCKIIIMSTTNIVPAETWARIDYTYTDAQIIASHFGLKFIDSRKANGLTYYNKSILSRDDVHLTLRGADCLAQEVIKAVRDINWVLD